MTSSSTITERVAQLHATMAAQPPSEVMGAFAREQAGLAAGGLPDGIAPAGTVLPDAELLDVHGAATTLSAAARRSWSSTGALGARTATSPCPPTRSSCSPSSPAAVD